MVILLCDSRGSTPTQQVFPRSLLCTHLRIVIITTLIIMTVQVGPIAAVGQIQLAVV